MGLIALVWGGGFLAVIAMITFAYGFAVYHTITNKKLNKIFKPFIIISASIIVAVLFSPLHQYYNSRDMIYVRGFFGLAPEFSETINLKCGDNLLNYTRSTNYNSGARGGAHISSTLSLIQNDKKKEIEILTFNKRYVPYKIPEQTIIVRKKDDKAINYIDIFVDPEIFSMDEFKLIGKVIVANSEKLEQIIDDSNSFSSTPRFSRISCIYYLNRKTLKRSYKCKNDITIMLTENGEMSAYSTNPNSIFARSTNIGKAINNGSEISLYRRVYSIEMINTGYKNQLLFPETTIEECYDTKSKTHLFDEFIFSNEIE